MYQKCVGCAEYIKGITGDFVPETAIVLGSGLGGFADSVDVKFTVDYKNIPGFPISTVKGHNGRFLFGTYNGKNIVIAQGRVHFYEGYTLPQVVMPVRVLRLLGVNTIVLTNAAGGINDTFKPGDLMLITDHIGLFTDSPLIGANIDEFGPRFPDMSEVYDNSLKSAARSAAKSAGIDLKEGVYAQVKGPQYETPAEVRALKILGADAVGMSTAGEAIAARHCCIKVCGISAITNIAAGIAAKPLDHNEVIDITKTIEAAFGALICGIIDRA